jgi:hypothetical protein
VSQNRFSKPFPTVTKRKTPLGSQSEAERFVAKESSIRSWRKEEAEGSVKESKPSAHPSQLKKDGPGQLDSINEAGNRRIKGRDGVG